MSRSRLCKISLSVAALAFGLGVAAPAMAGGYVSAGYYSGYRYGGGYYAAGYRHHGYYGHRGHYYGHHHHGGGKAAAIALGVIGGAIILNEIAEDRARDRYYRDRYYEERYRNRYPPPRYDEDPAYDAGPQDGNLSDDEIEGALDGGPEPIRYSAQGAYNACIVHARAALSDRGFILSSPSEPETAEDTGRAWKMTATVLAQKGAESWSRAMYCEADEGRVYLLELI